MQIENATPFVADWTLGLAPDGRELAIVVVKATYGIPLREGEAPQPLPDQEPTVKADVYAGDPARSAPLYESDFAPEKPRCDLLLNGSAYAPGGRPVTRTSVGMSVGSWSKVFDVVGPRAWVASLGRVTASAPVAFTVQPISYETAFGGIDETEQAPRYFGPNHAGVGYHATRDARAIDRKPLPATQETGVEIQKPSGSYRPMAFGPVGRAWEPRAKLAGTYDRAWRENVAPFLPADFDPRYYQAAPADQQVAHLAGGEEVVLANLTPAGRTAFRLPVVDLPITFFLRGGATQEFRPRIDTAIIEPDLGRLLLCWRAALPLRRDIFDLELAVVGRMPRGWYRAREVGKPYEGSLGQTVERARERERAARRDEEELAELHRQQRGHDGEEGA